ncbi:uncharacterized protein TNCV_4767251 [Trichonephila clavipes]|nr:uncharacterized protein TNCV_4767251 [Trichonephila clavipes]
MLISRWWEGPLWLRESPEYWPLGEIPGDSEEVELEKRKKLKVVNIDLSRDAPPWHLNEYLSQLIQKHNEKASRDPQIGEVVLVGDDNKKRLFWALAKIIELIPGRDGKIRTVRLKTQHGKMLRPIQRIYPLEIRSNEKSSKGYGGINSPLCLKLCHPMRLPTILESISTYPHDDDEIAPENKFQYLVQATVNGSRAREVVESFPATAANYAKAVESLKARFGTDDLLVEVYVRELLKLIVSVQKQEKISMTSLYDKLESYLRVLETLGVTTEKYASILYPMVESCFQEDFLKAWNRSATSLTNLMTFLKAETEAEERINLAMLGFGLGVDENRQSFKKKEIFQ